MVDLLDRLDVPVLQAVLCTSSRAEWDASDAGLTPRDTAMNVVLPEFDGRINTVAISFKEEVGNTMISSARRSRPTSPRPTASTTSPASP